MIKSFCKVCKEDTFTVNDVFCFTCANKKRDKIIKE